MAYNSKAVREEIAEIYNRLEAIQQLAGEEDRDLTPEEDAEFKAGVEEIGNSGDNGQAATGMWAKVKTAERYEAIKAKLDAPANNTPRFVQDSGDVVRVKRKYRSGPMKGYAKGDEETAYRAGQWAAAALFCKESSRKWCADNGMTIRAAQTEGSNQDGGFLVPDELSQAIIDLRETYGVFRSRARRVGMGSDHMNVPRRLSGVTAYAVGENDAITASDKTWNRVELTAKKWGALTRYSSELSEDAFIDLASDLASEFAYAFSLKEDQSGFIGDGGSTYHGITGLMVKAIDGNHAASVHQPATGTLAFSDLTLAMFETALGKLPQYAVPNAAWYISRVGYYASMANLQNAAGGNNSDDIGAGPGMNFMGLPVVISQVLNTTLTDQASAAVCAVGDLSLAATIGDRRDFSVAVSTDRYFENDEVAIRGTQRTAINVHDLGDGSTAGPMVVIQMAAS